MGFTVPTLYLNTSDFEAKSDAVSHALNQTNRNCTGSTILQPDIVSWSTIPAFFVVFSIFGILTNSSVLVMILSHNHLRTPFSFYLLNLLTLNLLYFTTDVPLNIINALYSRWWMGETVCTLYLYISNVLEAVLYNSHALITVNRIWAITFPVSYKHYHSKQIALSICIGVWVYAHVVMLPGVIQDALFYRQDSEVYGCYLEPGPQYTWKVVTHVLVFDAAELIVVGAYPFLWYKNRQRRNVVSQKPVQSRLTEQSLVVTVQVPVAMKNERPSERSYAFLVLTFLTLNVLICWTLVQTYYGILIFTQINLPVLFKIAYLLFGLAPVLDPIYFTIALKDLRTAFTNVFKKNTDQRKRRNITVPVRAASEDGL